MANQFWKRKMIIEKIRKWFGFGKHGETDYKTLVDGGARIIDVRTPAEFSTGHIPNSTNIPLALLDKRVAKLGKDQKIILCCASGMRSATAKDTLLSMGYRYVHNGGSWSRLMNRLKEG